VTTRGTASATESTELAATLTSVEDPKASDDDYRKADHPEQNAGLSDILRAAGDTPVKDLTPSEVSVLSAIMSQTSELGKMLATSTVSDHPPAKTSTTSTEASAPSPVPSGCVAGLDGYYKLEIDYLSGTNLVDTGKHVNIKKRMMTDLRGETSYLDEEQEIIFGKQLPPGVQPASSWIVCGTDLYLGVGEALSWWHCAESNGPMVFNTQVNDKFFPVLMQLVADTPRCNRKRSGDDSGQPATPYPPNEHDASPADTEARRLAEAGLIGRDNLDNREANNEVVQDTALTTSMLTPTPTNILTPISSTVALSSTVKATPTSPATDAVEKRENGRCVNPPTTRPTINAELTTSRRATSTKTSPAGATQLASAATACSACAAAPTPATRCSATRATATARPRRMGCQSSTTSSATLRRVLWRRRRL